MDKAKALKKTQAAFFWTRVLRTPFWAIYGMLPFILYRDLHASPFLLAVVIALKPTVSIASVYWGAAIDQRPDRLRANVIWAGILGVLPFFFFPVVNNPWFFVGAFGLFMLLHRGVIPAWMEILRRNVPGVQREKLFAYSSAVGYLGDALLPIALGWVLDGNFQAWRWLFPITAFISLFAILFQVQIPIPKITVKPVKSMSLREPWRQALTLVKERGDFRIFQLGFMLGGAGLMIMHPALPMYFVDHLNISYTELAIALTLCKGLGYAAASPLWAEWMTRVDLFRVCGLVTLLALIFPLFLILAPYHITYLYIAYIGYGIMQAGSELSWNLSGPHFAGDQESGRYTNVNILTVGIRGCFAPALGSLLYSTVGATPTLLVGGLFCLLATTTMFSRTVTKAFLPRAG